MKPEFRFRVPAVAAIAAAAMVGANPTHAKSPARQPQAVEYVIDARQLGPVVSLDFIGNASRLDTLLGLKSGADLHGGKGPPKIKPSANFFRARFPHFRQFRIGNLFVGYSCADLDFDELAIRGADGRLHYRFDQTLEMLQLLVSAGIKPHLALTGTPLALVPPGEAPVRHRTYGCVNAPRFDWTKSEPRERVPDWWNLQDAFLSAAVKRFGKSEVQSWTFATWTEPMNPRRKPAHLVLPEDVVASGRHDEAVASIIAASIDVAMRYQLRVRIGNLAGRVEQDYPELIRQIARFPRGREYLAFLTGYAVSRYRTRPGANFGPQIDRALSLLRDPAMPDKPLYIDELGDLANGDGVRPFAPAAGLRGANFLGGALERIHSYAAHDPVRKPVSVAFWPTQIAPRAGKMFDPGAVYLNTPSDHVVRMFASMNGRNRLIVAGHARRAVAVTDGTRIMVLLLGESAQPGVKSSPLPQSIRTLTVLGLKSNAQYDISTIEVTRTAGNPISVFLDGAEDYREDSKDRFRQIDGRWRLASPKWAACYFDEDQACAWRDRARTLQEPIKRSTKRRSGSDGSLVASFDSDGATILMIDITAAK